MKRFLFCGIAMTLCCGLAASAFAQINSDRHPASSYLYSSYGYYQDTAPEQDPSPSDQLVPAPTADLSTAPDVEAPAALSEGCACGGGSDCDCGGASFFGGRLGGRLGGCGGCGLLSCRGGCGLAGGVGGGLRSADSNRVFGVRGLLFGRDYEDDRGLGYNWAGDNLFTTDADHGAMGGFETYYSVRNCSGWGWQLGYWGIYPSQADVTFTGAPLTTTLTGLGQIDFNGQWVDAIYNSADDWRIYRDTTIHNLEWNVLRNGGSARGYCGNQVNLEWMAGFRWFHFEEAFRYGTFTSNAAYPAQLFYDVSARNNLLGFQLGGRTEHCLTDRLSLSIGTKVGIYNNDIKHRQSIHDDAGMFAVIGAGPYAGQDYRFESRKDDVSMLGEIDLGLNYRLGNCWRANVGWRAIGVSGIALAVDQIPYNFTDSLNVNRVESNGNLLLHGAYFGLERAF